MTAHRQLIKNQMGAAESPMFILSEEQVQEALDLDEAVVVLEKMFRRDYAKTVEMPLRTQMQIFSDSTCLVMPCSDSALPGACVKVVTVHHGEQFHGNRVQADCFLLEQASGRVCAVLAANYLTEIRTAAVSAIATKFLARPDARTLGIFGTGRQALAHILLLSRDRRFERFMVCGAHPSRSKDFAGWVAASYGVALEPVDPATCAIEADVLCTCTTSKTPIFDGKLIREGAHLNLIGGFQPEIREVDDTAVSRARIVVDSYEGALAEAGDLLIPLSRGTITKDHIIADLHQIVSRKIEGRPSVRDITIFKSVGFALEDLVLATLVYESVQAGQPHQ
jgi:ornithine cyclodeaminase/alanine dehydrogenase-like protein (mu-crystallin family)